MAWQIWKPKVLADATFPFMTINAILGFGVFQYPVGRPRILISVIYVIIFSCVIWSAFIKTVVKSFDHNHFSKANNKSNYYLNYVNQITAASAQILSFWHVKKQLRVIKRLMKIDNTLYKLGASFNYRQCLLFGIINLSFSSLLIFGQILCRVLWLVDVKPLTEAIFETILTKYALIISTIIAFQFWFILWYLGHKYYAVNKLLEEPYKHIYDTFENDDFATMVQKRFNITSFNMSLCQHLINNVDRSSFIQIIKHVHLEITLLSKDVNEIYGGLLLLEFTENFVLFTSRSYLLCDLMMQPQIEKRLVLTIATLSWMVPCFLKILLINSICDSVTDEAKRTGNLIYHFTHSDENPEFSAEVKQFGFQLYNVPIQFSPIGFFVLGYRFMRGFFGTVLTYLIIVIQVDSDEKL